MEENALGKAIFSPKNVCCFYENTELLAFLLHTTVLLMYIQMCHRTPPHTCVHTIHACTLHFAYVDEKTEVKRRDECIRRDFHENHVFSRFPGWQIQVLRVSKQEYRAKGARLHAEL